jgi:hypothetical protein
MTQLFVFNDGAGDSDEDITLGTPDASEEKDLTRHVERCALRYRMFRGAQRRQAVAIGRVQIMLYVVLVLLVLSNPLVDKVFASAGKVILP